MKHKKIVEVLKEFKYALTGIRADTSDISGILHYATAIEQIDEPEGEVLVYDAVISELDAQTVSWRGAKCILAEHYERIAENISENVSPPQQPSVEPKEECYVECNTADPDAIYVDANDNDGKWIGWIKKISPPQQPSDLK